MTTAPTPCARASEPRARRTGGPGQRGISLVEIMVAMAIGLVIVLIATTVYTQGVSNFSFRTGQSENLGNSRYALDTIEAAFTKAGYRRDPTQNMKFAFPANATAYKNGCQFAAGEAIKVPSAGVLCIRFQARDKDEKDCAGTAAGINSLAAYEAPPAPAIGAGMFVEKYFVATTSNEKSLVCLSGDQDKDTEAGTPVADRVSDVLFEYGVGKAPVDDDSMAERKVESYKTTVPAADEVVRSLRYSLLFSSTAGGLSSVAESSVCDRWAALGGAKANCDLAKGQLYQVASGSLMLRNLMP
ncbi:MAG: pilus assembly protein PilW [Variovorax paradoxus]|uniref:Pilus assembly protein PilW n=1 Tax=Variovorax paradoxus TaxID=34073 RepID=A0A2W5QES3_VARPD|nr:MAG: pilus assembly protein PilW [Variovorax paradoxus]